MRVGVARRRPARHEVVGFVEGISFLLLLGVAMPLKYLAGLPKAVSVVGMIHGVLFVLYVFAVGHAWMTARWPVRRAFILLLASLIPFGTFLTDARLKREQRAAESLAAGG